MLKNWIVVPPKFKFTRISCDLIGKKHTFKCNYLRILRWNHSALSMSPKSKDWWLYKMKRGHRNTGIRDGDCEKVEAEIKVMLPQAKECQDPPEAGRGKAGFSLKAYGRGMVLPTPWFQTSALQNHERINFCSFNPLILWYFLMADLRH